MLLPRPIVKEDGSVEDPRTELVNRLLEYKRFKETLPGIEQMEEENGERLKRAFAIKEESIMLATDNPEDELVHLDLYSIMRAFYRVWERQTTRRTKPRHVIQRYPYSMDEVKNDIRQKLEEKEKIDFASFILDKPDKFYCVFSFLSVLEMAQYGQLHVVVGKGFNNFWITRIGYQDSEVA
jgi:segregation and condensation protein A